MGFSGPTGDSTGDGEVRAGDIAELVSCCVNSTCSPAYRNVISCDINHSGLVTSEDIVRHVDLLNGSGGFATWLNQTSYDGGECD